MNQNKLEEALEKIARQQIPTFYDGVEWQLISTISIAQKALQEHAANKEGWISLEDRLPEDNKDYQVWEKGAIIATAAHYNTKEYFLKEYGDENYMEEGWYYSFKYPFDGRLDMNNPITVTHWQPLPSPPNPQP